MPQTTVLHARGLYDYPNQLGELPVGALTAADNVVIDRDGVLAPRRGLSFYGDAFGTNNTTAKQLLYYKGRILRHWANSLDFDNDGAGTFVNLSSTVTEQQTGVKIKFQEMNGNLYFTSNQGIQKISATSASTVASSGVTVAGGPEGLDGVGYLNSTPGWFTQDSSVAYRVVWGIKDSNTNLIQGSPSQRIIVSNSLQTLIINDFNKLLQALDIAASVGPVVLTGDTHTSTTIDGISSTASLSVGMNVSGGDIPVGTTISLVSGPNSILISQAATASTVGETLTFSQNLSDTNYSSSLALPSNSSSVEIFNGVTGLSKKLDADLVEHVYAGRSGSITNITPTFTQTLTANANYSATLTNVSSLAGIRPLLQVSGPGVPVNTIVAAISPSTPTSFTGDLTTNSLTVANATGTPAAGDTITGAGIVAGTTIVSVSGTTLTLSQPAAVTATAAPLFYSNNTITLSQSVAAQTNNAVFTFTYPTILTSTNHGLTGGEKITISGSNSSPSIDTTIPVQIGVIDSDNLLLETVTSLGGNTGTWTQFPQAIAELFTQPSDPATNAQLILLQNFYDGIVNQLNVDPNIAVIARQAVGGNFSNSTQSSTVNLIFSIPEQVTTAYFYQVYRGDLATAIGQTTLADQTPDDECKLIIEDNPSSQDLINGYIKFDDNVTESFRLTGANLYTNAISGAGILQENTPPPYAQDLCLWMNFMFFANTSTKHQKQINLLTGQNLVGHTFSTTYGATTTNYTFVTEQDQITRIVLPAGSTFASSGPADYFDIFNAQNYCTYRFWFSIGTATAPSSVGVQLIPVVINSTDTNSQVASKLQYAFSEGINDFSTSISTNTLTITNVNPGFTNSPSNHITAIGFSITVTTPGSGEDAATQKVAVPNSPTPAQQIDAAARSLVRIINRNPNSKIFAQYLSGPTDLPGQILLSAIKTEQVPFSLTSSIGASFDPALPISGTTVSSDNNSHKNRIYFSKIQQPDAVPQTNFQDVGQEDYAILRVMPLRDSLFIIKEDGVYRLYGTDPSNFTIYLFDSSAKLLAQDTAVVLNNQVYMLSNQGVVTVSDTGVEVLSRPIEGFIVPVTTFNNYTSISFGVSYESDRAYMLWLQNASTDTQATTCYRYSTFTKTWVKWPITKTCARVIPDTNILYVGAGDTNFIEKERKTYTRLDQADREYIQTVPSNAINKKVLSLGSIFQAAPGDAIVQTQYLTVAQYNRLIDKLDRDPGVKLNYTDQIAIAGDNLRGSLTNLATKLDTDPGLTNKNYSSSIVSFGTSFQDTQDAFNIIVGLLNSDTGARLHNYSPSTYTTGWETLVLSVDKTKQTITVQDSLPFIQGPISIFKAINSDIEWCPQHCGDPSMLKKVHEGTIMFENMGFDNAMASYSSDLYTGQSLIPFSGDGCDIWGGVNWGQGTWGGDGTSRPFRTYIPTPVQRCRYIQAFFSHSNAMRTFAVFGISYTWEPVSSRAYR